MNIEAHSLKTVDHSAWNDQLCTLPEGCFYQTTAYASYAEPYFRRKSVFLKIYDEGSLVGQLLYFVGPPTVLAQVSTSLLDLVSKLPFKTVSWQYGPLVFDKKKETEIVTELVKWVQKKERPFSISFFPAFYSNLNEAAYQDLTTQLGFEAKQSATIITTLKQETRQQVWNKNQHSLTKLQHLELAEVATEADLRAFYDIYVQTRQRTGVRYPPYKMFELLWNSEARRYTKIFVAKHHNEIVAGQMLSFFNGIVNQSSISISDEALKQKIHANDLLQWNVLTWAVQQGFRFQDLGGYEIGKLDAKQEGINHFKRRWGNQIIYYHEFSRTYPSQVKKVSAWIKSLKRQPAAKEKAEDKKSIVVKALTEKYGDRELAREMVARIGDNIFEDRFDLLWKRLVSRQISKDSFEKMVRLILADPSLSVEHLLKSQELDLVQITREWFLSNAKLVQEKRTLAKNAFMGDILKKYPLLPPRELSEVFDKEVKLYLEELS